MGAVIVIVAPAASALPPESCLGPEFNVEGTNNATQTPNNYKGIKSLTWVAAEPDPQDPADDWCRRVSSVGAVRDNAGRWVEWGWILGWDSDSTYHTTPRLLFCWKTLASSFDCNWSLGNVGASQNITFTVQDGDGDNTWSAYLYSYNQFKDEVTLDFKLGQLFTNGERDDCGIDIPWSHFDNLKKWTSGDAGYASWGAHYQLLNTDPNFRYRIVSNTESYVERDNYGSCT